MRLARAHMAPLRWREEEKDGLAKGVREGGFLDYGMMGRLTKRHRECLGGLVVGVVRRDEKTITKALLALSAGAEPESVDSLEVDVADLVEQHLYRPLSGFQMGASHDITENIPYENFCALAETICSYRGS